ncbi:ATP-binding protein [Mycolicibacterium mucogenicum]|uniref:ATP-binding protein n=1 Tax=Mycolicibacterium mucogenicum TaxID=56689 RepID=UPI002269808A|nr:ATP-binding protein [Mycolicibacterium mucogenicum]MCX8564648.1 ATP-binding protein [Mycolicibacterium mucogenicum]
MSGNEEVFLDDVLVKHAERLRWNTTLSIRTELRPTYVVGDAPALNRAVAILVDHSLNRAISTIDLAVFRHDAHAIITVGDDGLAGCGSELDAVRRIVAAHGGTLAVTERNPCGKTVSVRLPSTRVRPSKPTGRAGFSGNH